MEDPCPFADKSPVLLERGMPSNNVFDATREAAGLSEAQRCPSIRLRPSDANSCRWMPMCKAPISVSRMNWEKPRNRKRHTRQVNIDRVRFCNTTNVIERNLTQHEGEPWHDSMPSPT